VPVVLNITADDAAGLVAEFRRLNDLTMSSAALDVAALRAMPLNDFMDIANAKLRPQGFKIVVDEPDAAPVVEPEPEPEPKAKKAKAKVEETPSPAPSNNVEEFPAPRRTKRPEIDNLKTIAETPDAESDPEGDRQHVLDTLAGILRDPNRKAEVLAFTGKQAKLHGTEKISELPAAPFPSIRREMEKAFPDVRSSA
jgi:hypothetical protein